MAEELTAVSGVSGGVKTVDIESVMTSDQLYFAEAEAASISLDRALGRALVPPGQGDEATREAAELSRGGAVGLERAEMLASLDPESIKTEKTELDKEMDAVIERVKVMYGDFANWQVSWSMASSLQKDVSHLVKGQ